MQDKPLIKIVASNLLVSYADRIALDLPSLEVQGTVIGIIGENGAGKSTLIRTLLGLTPPSRGSCSAALLKSEIQRVLTPEDDMAFCPEVGAVFADVKVADYLSFWCRLKRKNPHYYKSEGQALLEQLDIGPLLRKRGRELSKGQKRRVQTAVAFLCNPALMLFDEPFDGLDLKRSTELSELIKTASKKHGFIISSHRMDIMQDIADSLILLHEGRLISSGTIEQLCTEVAGSTWRVSSVSGPANQENSPELGASQELGCHLLKVTDDCFELTGHNLNAEKVTTMLSRYGLTHFSLSQSTPSLVQAIHSHMHKFK